MNVGVTGEIVRSNDDREFRTLNLYLGPSLARRNGTTIGSPIFSKVLAYICVNFEKMLMQSGGETPTKLIIADVEDSLASTVERRKTTLLVHVLKTSDDDFKVRAPKTKKFSRDHFAKPKSQAPSNSSRFHKSVHHIPTKTKMPKSQPR